MEREEGKGSNGTRMMLKFYLWVMGWSGKINTWAWNKQANIIKEQQRKQYETLIRNEENFKYLEELKRKL
jgi:hypothetical protein